MTRNKMGLRLALDDISLTAGQSVALRTARASRDFSDLKGTECGVANGSWPTSLRLVVTLLLMMVVGVSGVKAQDYSGIFLIANNNDKTPNYNFDTPNTNFYMCPAEGYVFYLYENNTNKYTTTDTGMPFLTTYQCYNHSEDYDLANALWEIQKIENTNYYYIIHKESEKYLTYNGKIDGTTKDGRMRFHLETNASPGNTAQFTISKSNDGYFNISPRNNSSYYLNPAKGNYDNLAGEPGNNNSYLGKEGAPSGISIYGIVGMYNDATDVGSKWYLETLKPVINYDSSNNKIVLSHVDENATIYYTTDGNDPSTEQTDNKGVHSIEITNVNSSVTIKAIAERSGIVSHVSEIRIVPNATISFGSSPIVYNGSAQEPTVTVKDGNDVISSSEYSVNYSNNNTNAGETVTVTITDNAGGDYIVCGSATFTISPKPLTITANDKTITYGDEPANDGVTYSEFAGTETSSVLTGTLSYAYNYSQYGDAGSYTITPSGLSNSNYDITFVPGTLTVNKKEVTVTSGITASDKTYDGTTDATLDGSTAVVDGKIGSDDLTVLAGAGTFADKNVGTDKTVTINSFTFGGAKAGNYQMAASGHQATAQASITPATLTVTAEAKSKTYGDADPALTYTSSGLVGEDAITGALTRAAGENAGTYAISQGTLTAGGNYSISYTGENLTIEPKSLGDGLTPAAGVEITMDESSKVTVKVTLNSGLVTLKNEGAADDDYSTSSTTLDDGTVVVTITGTGNYTGSAEVLRVVLAFDETGAASGENVKDVSPYMASADMDIIGLDAWIVTSINMTKHTVTLQKLAVDYVPKDVPVLLLTDLTGSETSFIATPKYVETSGDYSTNLLKKTTSSQTVDFGEIYIYYQGKFVLTTDGTVPAGSFYLDNPNPIGSGTSNAPLFIEFDFMTGIENSQLSTFNSQLPNEWYTLDGRRFSGKPTKKGLYIMNGQKIVVK